MSIPGPAMPPMQGESGAPFVASATEVVAPAPAPTLAEAVTPAVGTAIVHDATHANIAHLPPGHAAGYVTGSPDIRWTVGDFKDHPGAVWIDQDAAADDPVADVLDVETGAATPAEAPRWAKVAKVNYLTAKRKGMRDPLIYMSASNVTAVTNALIGGGVTSGIGLWVANFNLSQAEAESMVKDASGPFPIMGVQYTDNPPGNEFDTSVFSATWLAKVADKSQWLRLTDVPHNAPVYYNENAGTLGYMNTAGKWTKVPLP